jgi:hypothetical protein
MLQPLRRNPRLVGRIRKRQAANFAGGLETLA